MLLVGDLGGCSGWWIMGPILGKSALFAAALFGCALDAIAQNTATLNREMPLQIQEMRERQARNGDPSFNSSGDGALGGLLLAGLAIYAVGQMQIENEINGAPRSHHDARHSRARHLANSTLFLPDLASIWFDDNGYAVTLNQDTGVRTVLEWRVAGDRACFYEPGTPQYYCIRLNYVDFGDAVRLGGVYLASGQMRQDLQLIDLDIDNQAQFAAAMPPIQRASATSERNTAAGGTSAIAASGSTSPEITSLFNSIVAQDARNWAVYRYHSESVRNARLQSSPNPGEQILYGEFTYSGLWGPSNGWARISLSGANVNCIHFWDETNCRPLGFTPSQQMIASIAGVSPQHSTQAQNGNGEGNVDPFTLEIVDLLNQSPVTTRARNFSASEMSECFPRIEALASDDGVGNNFADWEDNTICLTLVMHEDSATWDVYNTSPSFERLYPEKLSFGPGWVIRAMRIRVVVLAEFNAARERGENENYLLQLDVLQRHLSLTAIVASHHSGADYEGTACRSIGFFNDSAELAEISYEHLRNPTQSEPDFLFATIQNIPSYCEN